MRWANYRGSTDGLEHAGLLNDGVLHGVEPSLLTILEGGVPLDEVGQQAMRHPVEVVPLDEAALLAPIPRPPSVRDFMAFEAHVVTALGAVGLTVDPAWYDLPAFYFSNAAAVLGPVDPVPIAPGSQAFDYELEVAAVIGTAGADLDPGTAERHIAGFTLLCDWSARDLQVVETRIGLGPVKGKDTATTIGPLLVTLDELDEYRSGNGYDLAMTASVNGRPYSRGTWSEIYWSFGQMLAYASRGTHLLPGDVLGSGTVGTGCIIELSGVHGSASYPWLSAGDEVHLEVAELGALTCTIVPGPAPVRLR